MLLFYNKGFIVSMSFSSSLYLCFSSSSSTSSCSTTQMSWDSGCSREGHGLGGDWGDEDLGCMRTRCLGFHEAGEGQREEGKEVGGHGCSQLP